MAHFRSDPALVPLEDFTIHYVRDYMGCRVRGDKYGDLLKVQEEHWHQARTEITTFVNDGGKPGIFEFTSSSRNDHCPPEVFKKRWDRLAKELSPKAIKEPANKIYDLYNACSITVMHRGKRPLAKTSKKCMHQDHWKFDAAKFESPLSQRHRLLTQGTKPSVRETVQAGAASSLPQAVPAGAAAGAACGTGSPASQQGPARKRCGQAGQGGRARGKRCKGGGIDAEAGRREDPGREREDQGRGCALEDGNRDVQASQREVQGRRKDQAGAHVRTRAPRHDPHCAWYITSPRRPSQHPRCVRVYWHTLAHHMLTLSHTHTQLEQDLQVLRRHVADGFLNRS
jgi:hypothetical protein